MPDREGRELDRLFQPSSGHRRCPALSIQGSVRVWQHQAAEGCNVVLGAAPRPDPPMATGGEAARGTRLATSWCGCPIIRAPASATCSNTSSSPRICLAGTWWKGESVDHINGVRDDNRRENLELWTRPQPSGHPGQRRHQLGAPDLRAVRRRWRPPTVLTVSPEHPWRWRGSNPRPSVLQQSFSERSRWRDLGPSPITGSGGGPQSVEVSPRAH